MLEENKTTRIMGLAAPLALTMALMAAPAANAEEFDKFWGETTGDRAWETNYGECWEGVGGSPDLVPCGCAARDSDGDGVNDCDDKCPDTPAGAKVDANGCEIIASLTIDLVNDEFDFDKSTLKPAMMVALDDVARRVEETPGDEYLTIIGHTDSVGSEAYNMGLGQRRADATADYLISQGVRADRITTKSMGESQPVADNSTAEGRAKNRRVEIQSQ